MKYAIKMKDGSVRIMTLISGNAQSEVSKWIDADDVLEIKNVTEKEIPQDRYFRGAWTYDFDIDMEKARKIHMDNIREVRNMKLQSLDVKTMMGIDVQAEKQILRDIPQKFDLSKAKSPNELKSMWPEELHEQE